jgi:hypothetical protein
MANAEPAMQALGLLGLNDPRYADVLMGLSRSRPGQFVHRDVAGNLGYVSVNVDYNPGLKAALMTDPVPVGTLGWALEEEDAR